MPIAKQPTIRFLLTRGKLAELAAICQRYTGRLALFRWDLVPESGREVTRTDVNRLRRAMKTYSGTFGREIEQTLQSLPAVIEGRATFGGNETPAPVVETPEPALGN